MISVRIGLRTSDFLPVQIMRRAIPSFLVKTCGVTGPQPDPRLSRAEVEAMLGVELGSLGKLEDAQPMRRMVTRRRKSVPRPYVLQKRLAPCMLRRS
jgi:hypothetical protein